MWSCLLMCVCGMILDAFLKLGLRRIFFIFPAKLLSQVLSLVNPFPLKLTGLSAMALWPIPSDNIILLEVLLGN